MPRRSLTASLTPVHRPFLASPLTLPHPSAPARPPSYLPPAAPLLPQCLLPPLTMTALTTPCCRAASTPPLLSPLPAAHAHTAFDAATECSICGECACHPCDPLVVPCACKTRPVHASCLQRWLLTRPHEGAARFRCEVCGERYWGGDVGFAVWLVGVGVWVGLRTWYESAVGGMVARPPVVDKM